jgi:hypothetical protein
MLPLLPILALLGTPAAGPELPSLPALPFGSLEMLLEKTIFQIDVVRVAIRLDESGAERLAPLAAADGYGESLADTVAAVVLSTPDVDVDLRFVHGASRKQFLNGARNSMKRVVRAGWITEAQARDLGEKLPRWYGFLEDRGVKVGDVMRYRVRGDTIRYLYTGVEGETLLDFTGDDPHDRFAVLGSYFAPGSEFRKKLVSSLLRPAP